MTGKTNLKTVKMDYLLWPFDNEGKVNWPIAKLETAYVLFKFLQRLNEYMMSK